ncbi:hypothetical protein [Pararhodobacter sp. SW119]|uniref:hypothetical protein n=1 Tax=Pararhodobacter sp. SW119 TaxID=2780075 RepID=UPI001ADFA60E|nr:hypothetical protein [Pararhodobacter sp. SW119]
MAAIALAALTITVFILNLPRAAERAARAAERLDQLLWLPPVMQEVFDPFGV